MCYVDPGKAVRKVAPNCRNVLVLTACIQPDLAAQASRLKAIATGAKGAQPVEFACGCRIEQYQRTHGSGTVLAVKLIQPIGPGQAQNILLKGHQDFQDFLVAAQRVGGGLFGNLTQEMNEKGIPIFLSTNRRFFSQYVQGIALAAARSRNVIITAGPSGPDVGRFKYIPVQQGIASAAQFVRATGTLMPAVKALECFGSTFVNALMSLGLVNPTLDRTDFEARYTHIHAAPTSQDDVAFDAADSEVLRGLTKATNTLRGGHVTEIVHRFQQTDWAKLMEMDRPSIDVVPLAEASATKVKGYLDEGWSVQLHTPAGVAYSNSDHWVTLRALVPPSTPGGAYRFTFTENDHYPDNPYDPSDVGIPSERQIEVPTFQGMGTCARTFVVR